MMTSPANLAWRAAPVTRRLERSASCVDAALRALKPQPMPCCTAACGVATERPWAKRSGAAARLLLPTKQPQLRDLRIDIINDVWTAELNDAPPARHDDKRVHSPRGWSWSAGLRALTGPNHGTRKFTRSKTILHELRPKSPWSILDLTASLLLKPRKTHKVF